MPRTTQNGKKRFGKHPGEQEKKTSMSIRSSVRAQLEEVRYSGETVDDCLNRIIALAALVQTQEKKKRQAVSLVMAERAEKTEFYCWFCFTTNKNGEVLKKVQNGEAALDQYGWIYTKILPPQARLDSPCVLCRKNISPRI